MAGLIVVTEVSLNVASRDGSLTLDCRIVASSSFELTLLVFRFAKLDVQSILVGDSLHIRFIIVLLGSSLLNSSFIFNPLNFPVVLATRNWTSASICKMLMIGSP